MTAQELHIDLDIQLQKINTNATRNIEPEEKDWLLNQEVAKFINSRTRDISNLKRKGFEEDTKRLKDVEPLIKTKEIDVEYIDAEKGRFILPSSVFKHVSTRYEFFKDCDGVALKDIPKTKYVKELTIPFNIPTSFGIVLYVQGVGYRIFDTAFLPDGYIGRGQAYLIKAIKVALQTLDEKLPEGHGIEVYYEWFGDTYKENTFFFVGGTKFTNAVITTLVKGVDTGLSFKNSSFSYIRKNGNPSIKRPGRLVSHEYIDINLSSSLSGSIAESPLWTTDKHFGTTYNPKNIIISGVVLTYICKPNIIDIDLGTSLNLDRDICAEIVVHTAKFIKALLDSGNYEKYFNETNLIE